jgi:DNA ligase-1
VKPILAGKANLAKLKYPVLASYKLDGIRALVIGGVVYSRKMKPIPSVQVQGYYGRTAFNGFDGELIVGPANAPDVCNRTQSHVMSVNKPAAQLMFHVFDDFTPQRGDAQFCNRSASVDRRCMKLARHPVVPVQQFTVVDSEILDKFEKHAVAQGYEGVMLRSEYGPYKQGRSTTREGYLLKLKRFEDGEAIVLSVEEEMHNANEKVDGKRTSHKAGKSGKGTLGALVVQDVKTRAPFNIGTGFTASERHELWESRAALGGRVVRYRFFPTGSKDAPRFPVFAGWRED